VILSIKILLNMGGRLSGERGNVHKINFFVVKIAWCGTIRT